MLLSPPPPSVSPSPDDVSPSPRSPSPVPPPPPQPQPPPSVGRHAAAAPTSTRSPSLPSCGTSVRRRRGRSPSRFVQRVVRDPGGIGHSWTVDRRFDIANHVVAAPADVARTPDDLRRFVSTMADRKLNWDRPLWELHVIPSPSSSTSPPPKTTTAAATAAESASSASASGTTTATSTTTFCLLRIHPAVCDGVRLVRLICSRLVDDDDEFAAASGWRTTARCHYGRLAYSFNVVRSLFVGESITVFLLDSNISDIAYVLP